MSAPECWDGRPVLPYPVTLGVKAHLSEVQFLKKSCREFSTVVATWEEAESTSIREFDLLLYGDCLYRVLMSTQSSPVGWYAGLKIFHLFSADFFVQYFKDGCFVETRSPVAKAGLKIDLSQRWPWLVIVLSSPEC